LHDLNFPALVIFRFARCVPDVFETIPKRIADVDVKVDHNVIVHYTSFKVKFKVAKRKPAEAGLETFG